MEAFSFFSHRRLFSHSMREKIPSRPPENPVPVNVLELRLLIAPLGTGQVLFSQFRMAISLNRETQRDAKYEMAGIDILCINTKQGGGQVMTYDTNIGSDFDAFLQEESMLEEATEVAIERVVDWLGTEALKDSGSEG